MEVSGWLHVPGGETPMPIGYEAGCPPEVVRIFGEEKNHLPVPGFEARTVLPVA